MMATPRLDKDAAWGEVAKAAAGLMKKGEVFYSTHKEAGYVIERVEPTRIVIDRLNGQSETLSEGEVRRAVGALNVANDHRVARHRLLNNVAKETALVMLLHRSLRWSADREWIEIRPRETNAFTHYWGKPSWGYSSTDPQGRVCNHMAGNQFRSRGVGVGDRVFVVTIIDGKMYVAGRLTVERYATKDEAERELGLELWDAEEHLLGRGTAMRYDLRVPDDVARRLRFGDGKPLVFAAPGVLDSQTLRGVRRLSPEAAHLLEGILKTGTDRQSWPTKRLLPIRVDQGLAKAGSAIRRTTPPWSAPPSTP